jgi:hypothetical protein
LVLQVRVNAGILCFTNQRYMGAFGRALDPRYFTCLAQVFGVINHVVHQFF